MNGNPKLTALLIRKTFLSLLRNLMLLGFWRGVCYFFGIVTIIAGLAYLFSAKYVFHEILGFMITIAGVFSIFMIRMIGGIDSIQHDLRYLADN